MWKEAIQVELSSLRLCFVHVKYFLENKYFPEMLFLRKENIFKCLVAFQKCFEKYFLVFGCVLENTVENTFFTCCSHFLSCQTNI